MTHWRFPLTLLTAGLSLAGSPALPVTVFAQGLEFEQVGDIPLDADELDFDQDGTLWADADELYRLLTGSDTWEEINAAAGIGGHLLVLSPDTLFLGSTNAIFRSSNGGETFDLVYKEGGALFAAETDGPNSGVILVGARTPATGISYSTDRGATFTEATFTVTTSSTPFMEDAVEIPDGPAEGRLVAGVFAGVVISEDGGMTWSPSSLFQNARFWVQRVEMGTHPDTGNRRLYATVADAQLPDVQFYYSDDDGLTWTNVPGMVDAFLFVFVPQGDGYLLAVERGTALEGDFLTVWRSDDSGMTWAIVEELPAPVNGAGVFSEDMLIGPDGHVYVAVSRAGPEREWVYRTTEPVVVANELDTPPLSEERISVYPNPATSRLTIEAIGLGDEVLLYDLLGREIRRSKLRGGFTILDTADLTSGVYVVRVGRVSTRVTISR